MSNQASKKQQQKVQDKARIRKLKQLAVDVEEVLGTLRHYKTDPELLKLVCNYLIGETERRIQIDSENAEALADMERVRAIYADLENLKDGKGGVIPANDRQIAIMKRHFIKTMKLVKHMSAKSTINEMEAQEHIRTLRHLMLRLEVDAYMSQAEKARLNEDNMTAGNLFKHAKEILVASEVGYDGKTEEIKNISKKIASLYTTVDSLKDKSESDESQPENQSHEQN